MNHCIEYQEFILQCGGNCKNAKPFGQAKPLGTDLECVPLPHGVPVVSPTAPPPPC